MDNLLTPQNFYFRLPVYKSISITNETKGFDELFRFQSTIDFYSPGLKENTTYKVEPCCINGADTFMVEGGWDYSKLTCLRKNEVLLFFYHYDPFFGGLWDGELVKIGQYPSIADFNKTNVQKYQKVLSKDKVKEFSKAIGLAAHGVGIGSFVYLRRIFETLLQEAYEEAKVTPTWNEEAYSKGRVADKIELLKDHLPTFLVENRKLYNVMSKGIHSLTEEECLAYFDSVKIGIELILDEKFESIEKKRKIEEATKSISAIGQKLKKYDSLLGDTP